MEQKPLTEPFSYHLYIGCAFEDFWRICEMAVKIKKLGYIVCSKYNFNSPETQVLSSINDGIARSYRCLLCVSDAYKDDKFAEIERRKLEKKQETFSSQSVLLLQSLSCKMEFTNFTKTDVNFNHLADDKSVETLANIFLQDTEVNLLHLPKENIAFGAAFGYFYGFLRFVLPSMKKNLYEKTFGGNEDMIKNAISKLLIVIPENCVGQVSLNVENCVETTDMYVITAANRAGTKLRDYKSSVYRIADKNGHIYYFIGEIATPMLSFYETYYYGLLGLTLEQLYYERDSFFVTLKSILNHSYNIDVRDKYRLLFWRNIGDSTPHSLYKFLLGIVKEEMDLKSSEEDSLNNPSYECSPIQEHKFMEIVEVNSPSPKAIYDTVACYNLNQNIRGKCLVFIFSECIGRSDVRKGCEKDEENIKKTFTPLGFEVNIYHDLTTSEVEVRLDEYRKLDHKRYGAFVCCLSSHGVYGSILTKDSKKPILTFTDPFSEKNCPTLKDKPKMFFVQCCQDEPDALPNTKTDALCFSEEERQENERFKQLTRPALTPPHPDFLMSYSCLPESVSYRSATEGSVYFQALRKCLKRNEDILSCLTKVASEVDKDRKHPQRPFYVNAGLNKALYL